METILFPMINVENTMIAMENCDHSATEIVTLDDVQMRQVGGGLCVEVVY